MAVAMGVRIGQLARRFVHLSYSHQKYAKGLSRFQFHTSPFLSVIGQEVKMPSLSPTMSEGTIVKWLKKEGDRLVPGDVLCDIQTDKAVVALEVEEEGILAKILIPENTQNVKVGTLIALTVNEGEDWKSVEYKAPDKAGPGPAAKSEPGKSATPDASSGKGKPSEKPKTDKIYGPAVRYLLEKYDVNPDSVEHTGRKKRILKEDVLKHIKDKNLQEKPAKKVPPPEGGKKGVPAKAGPSAAPGAKPGAKPGAAKPGVLLQTDEFKEIEITGIRRTIARRLLESKTKIPHAYSTTECDITKLLKFRKRLKSEGYGISINDLIIKAAGQALLDFPEVNAHWVDNKVVPVRSIDISIAVATKAGLITPIITDVPGKGITDICADMRDLASRARDGRLKPEEYQGGSFTISNLGMFGIRSFVAIINPPQCAILAVGTGQPFLGEEGKAKIVMCLSLSYDARAFDELVAADFLKAVRDMLEDPPLMLVGGFQQSKTIELEA